MERQKITQRMRRVPRNPLPAILCVIWLAPAAQAQSPVDIADLFGRAVKSERTGLARKTKPVDARPARPGEVVVTVIAGEGKETQSPPAEAGDMVVRNRCPATGNEEILVRAAKFGERYEGPIGPATGGWSAYRPRGNEMRYFEFDPPTARSHSRRHGERQ